MLDEKKVKAGKARAESLTAAERAEIARRAASERWAKVEGLPKETHTGILKLGGGLPCSVLDSGSRVFSANGLERAFGYRGKGSHPVKTETYLPSFLRAASLQPFIRIELRELLSTPIRYRSMTGGRPALGYEAELLHRLCETILDARSAGALRKSQLRLATAAELLMRGFARVGLVALIDEATGYQAERARDELQLVLEAYISKELLPWTRKFPDDFFKQVYRLHGWEYRHGTTKRPQYIGQIINKYVYEELPDGVLDVLRRKNPPVKGRRRHKHFQFLTEHTGNPHLDRQIVAVTTIMKLSDSKRDFIAKFLKLYPREGEQLLLDFSSGASDAQQAPPLDLVALLGSASERVMACLRTGNAVATADLAVSVYGKRGPATLNKLRKLLNAMKARKLVRSPSPGIWRIGSPA